MANPENLIPNDQRTPSERRENARKAGKASGRARRRKKLLSDCLTMLLEREYTDHDGNTMDGADMISVKLFRQALEGDIRAFQMIRDTIGQMPVQRVEVDTIDPEVREEMDSLLGIGGE